MSEADFDYAFDYDAPQTGFGPDDDILKDLETIPGIKERSAARQAAYEQMEREYRVGLASIRQAMSLTQVEVAERLGVRQTSVSRMETRPDMLISSLRGYLRADGAQASITIKTGNTEIRTTLDQLLPARR